MKTPFDENGKLNTFWNNLAFVKRKKRERIAKGILLLIIGSVWMLRELDYALPDWIFGFPSIFLLLGTYSLVKNGPQQIGAYIWIFLGSFFIVDQLYPNWNLKDFILPFAILVSGVIFLLNPLKIIRNWQWNKFKKEIDFTEDHSTSDVLSMDAILGSIEKTITSQDFKGGRIICLLGSVELNLVNADFQGDCTIEVTSIMGGLELIVPGNWEIVNEISAILGDVSDKRMIQSDDDSPQRKLHLRGTAVLGGIEIKSF
jgi:predicted membrane protein